MRRNNKGLSLVELIVAFAILAIVGIAITGFMAYSSRGYASANKNTKLQYEQQIVENHVRDNVMETTKAISFDATTSTLTLLGGKIGPSSTIVVSQYRYVAPVFDADGKMATSGKLYYLYQDSGITATKYSEIAGQLDSSLEVELTDTMAGFDFDLSKVASEQKVLGTLTFQVGDGTPITVYPEILLRNKIKVIGPYVDGDDSTDTSLDEIYNPEEFEVSDKVASVVIKRDDHLFAQGETDTIKMAGNSITVNYSAVVTKKSTYMGELTGDIVWSIVNKDNFKSDWSNYISLSDGTLTFKIVGGQGPEYALNGQPYVILRAAYKDGEDVSKYGQIRIDIKETGGVYPVSLTSVATPTENLSVGTLDYKLTHTITYTDGSAVTGDDAYAKLMYAVYEADGTTPSEKTISANGLFVATKSMENQTYNIKVTVLQTKTDGTKLEMMVPIKVGKVPDKKGDVTVPMLGIEDELLRNSNNAVSAYWSDGVPTYDNGKNYYYWYEIEIEPVKLDKTDSWYDTADDSERTGLDQVRTTFYSDTYKNVSISANNQSNEYYANGSRSVTLDRTKRIAYIYVMPYVDWKKNFAVKVTLRVKLCKENNYSNADYYMLTSESDNDKAFLTDDPDSAYSVSEIVKIVPVTMTLTPVNGAKIYDGEIYDNAYYYSEVSDKTVADYIKWGYNSTNEHDYNGNHHLWVNGIECKNYYGRYYKLFKPEFTGILINTNKYPNSLGGESFENNTLDAQGTATQTSALRRYKKNATTGEYLGANVDSDLYEGKIYRNNQAVLLAYLRINAKGMKDRYTDYPDYVEWRPILKDNYGNWVEGKSTLTGLKTFRYYTKSEYESKKPEEMN